MSTVNHYVASLIGSGDSFGNVRLADNSPFLVNATVIINDDSGIPVQGQIINKIGTSIVVVGDSKTGRQLDISRFVLSKNPKIYMFTQPVAGSPGLSINTAPATVADLTLYVDPVLGPDTNLGTATSPFKSLQAAIMALPKIIRHVVTINCAAGNYYVNPSSTTNVSINAFNFDSTFFDLGLAPNAPLVVINGATPTTVLNTFTSTSNSFNANQFQSTITLSSATWTVNQWVGKLLMPTGTTPNAGTCYAIVSNTSTSIVVNDSGNVTLGPGTYQVVDNSTVLYDSLATDPTNTAPNLHYVLSVTANNTGISFNLTNTNSFTYNNLKFIAHNNAQGFSIGGNGGFNTFNGCQFVTATATSLGIGGFATSDLTVVYLNNCVVSGGIFNNVGELSTTSSVIGNGILLQASQAYFFSFGDYINGNVGNDGNGAYVSLGNTTISGRISAQANAAVYSLFTVTGTGTDATNAFLTCTSGGIIQTNSDVVAAGFTNYASPDGGTTKYTQSALLAAPGRSVQYLPQMAAIYSYS